MLVDYLAVNLVHYDSIANNVGLYHSHVHSLLHFFLMYEKINQHLKVRCKTLFNSTHCTLCTEFIIPSRSENYNIRNLTVKLSSKMFLYTL